MNRHLWRDRIFLVGHNVSLNWQRAHLLIACKNRPKSIQTESGELIWSTSLSFLAKGRAQTFAPTSPAPQKLFQVFISVSDGHLTPKRTKFDDVRQGMSTSRQLRLVATKHHIAHITAFLTSNPHWSSEEGHLLLPVVLSYQTEDIRGRRMYQAPQVCSCRCPAMMKM